MSDFLDTHYKIVVKAITEKRLILFFGAGVNLCDRQAGQRWQHGQFNFLPSGSELASHLAESYNFPSDDIRVNCPSCKKEMSLSENSINSLNDKQNLLRVSQYVYVMAGIGPLYDELRSVFNADYPPTRLHKFFAALPSTLREKGYPPHQLILTTNYDDLLESAFKTANEPFDLVSYATNNDLSGGKFMHRLANGKTRLIEKPNKYDNVSPDKSSVILKIHGAVDRLERENDSYVITEDQYIDYLAGDNIIEQVPVKLLAKMHRSHFLFLGYGLHDWNLRVVLRRVWGEQKLKYKSWAIQLNPQPIDREFWRKRDVDILDIPLEDYIAELNRRLQALPHAGGVI